MLPLRAELPVGRARAARHPRIMAPEQDTSSVTVVLDDRIVDHVAIHDGAGTLRLEVDAEETPGSHSVVAICTEYISIRAGDTFEVREPTAPPSDPGRATTAVVPRLIGLDQESARAALVAVGLDLGNVGGHGSVVVAQGRRARDEVPLGTEIGIDLGGPTTPRVPDLQALSLDEARTALEKVGLELATATGPSDGVVVAQDPEAGTEVDPGSVVAVELEATTVAPTKSNRRPVVFLAGGAVLAGTVLLGRNLMVRRSRTWISRNVSVHPGQTSFGTDPAPEPDSDDDPGPVVRLETAVDDGEYTEEDDP